MSIARIPSRLWTLTVIGLHYLELIGYFFSQYIHVPAYLVVGDLGVYLSCSDVLVTEHLTDRLHRHALRQCHRGRERVPRLVDRRVERQSGMTRNMA